MLSFVFAFIQSTEINPLDVVGTIQDENPIAWVVSVLLLLALAFVMRLYLNEKEAKNKVSDEYLSFAKDQIQLTTNLTNNTINSFDKMFDRLNSIDQKSGNTDTSMGELKMQFHQVLQSLQEMKMLFNRIPNP